MLQVKLTQGSLSNLQAFLERTDLKGKEVMAYVEIMQALASAEEIEEETKA